MSENILGLDGLALMLDDGGMTPVARLMYAKHSPTPETFVKLGVGVVVKDDDERILLERRSDCDMWGLPGGRIEAGESVEQAAKREVLEETGLEVALTQLIGIYSDPCGRIVTYLDNGDVAHLVDVVVEARILNGELCCSAESVDLQFFTVNSLPPVVPPARVVLQDVLKQLSGQIR